MSSVVAHGIDLTEMARINRIWEAHGDRFLRRIYTPAEQAYCLECKFPLPRLTGRFAAKEAVLKVLGTGLRGGLEWTLIETLPDALGKPLVTLHGAARTEADQRGIGTILISVTHTGDYAMASAIGLAP
jgi:holo-[acyl-carrier protein] synthase